MSDLLEYVNILQGTESTRDFSRGNTLPIIARPWALHHWTPQTNHSPWAFHPSHTKLWGLRLTHQPSPWMRDYGSVLFMPFNGSAKERIEHQASAYDRAATTFRATFFKAELIRYGIEMEMSPSERGAIISLTRRNDLPIKVRFYFDAEHSVDWRPGSEIARGSSHNHRGGVSENFGLHFTSHFSIPPESYEPLPNGGFFVFPRNAHRVEIRFAASFCSHEIADVSLSREVASISLTTLKHEGDKIWNDLLGRIAIQTEDDAVRRTFYSCLYRCLLFPRFLDEIDHTGNTVHYSPYSGKVLQGSLCADNGFWDTYRTLYPLLALVYPDKLSDIMKGWLNACRETGWTPRWPSPGARDCMIGTHFDAVAADAISKGITDWGVEETYHYLWKDASEPSGDICFGRYGLEDYIRYGYVPCDRHSYSVSCTLDYAIDDFCVAQVSQFLGRDEEARMLTQRSQNFRNIFDSSTGFMRGRRSDGAWETSFHEFRWGGSYIEGGVWQHTFNVPHDPQGLISLYGGPQKLIAKLDQMLSSPALFDTSEFEYEIHEMTEMALAGFGQYAHSNQPVHHFLFLYTYAENPERTRHWVQRVLGSLYTPDTFPGDEDNGEMSAWYVFASLGLFPACPGRAEYVAFPSLVRSATIRVPGQRDIYLSPSLASASPIIAHSALLATADIATLSR